MSSWIPTIRSSTTVLLVAGITLGVTACSGQYPADPEGTLNRVTGGELRVGIPHQPPWTDTAQNHSIDTPGGIEVDILQDYAETIDAKISWHAGGEEHLIAMLKQRQLDVVIGGLTDKSPWESDAGITTSYAEAIGIDGKTTKQVMAVQMGENAFMASLERFLLEQDIAQQVP